MYYRPRGKYAINRKRLRLSQSWKTLGRDDRNELVNLLKVLGITIAVIAALYFVGIKGLTYIGGVWKFFTGGTGPPPGGEMTPPPRASNISQKSAELIVTLDKKPPTLTITKPKDGQAFSGTDTQIHVEGKTEAGTTVKVNEIQATVLADGIFKSTLVAKEGDNKITVVATDKAGNEKKVELSITYSP